MIRTTTVVLCVAIAIGSRAPQSTKRLSDAEVLAAIKVGEQRQSRTLTSSCTARPGFGEAMLRSNDDVLGAYDVHTRSNFGQIAAMADEAKRQYKPFTIKDMPATLRAPHVLVFAYPSCSNGYGRFTSAIRSIVLRSNDKKNEFVTSNDTQELGAIEDRIGSAYSATFPYDKVGELPAGDLEVVLVTEAGERRCKIGKKDRDKLFSFPK